MRYSCDFVQAPPPPTDPNYGSCLSSVEGRRSLAAAVRAAAAEAVQHARPGTIYALVYDGQGKKVADAVGESVEQVSAALLAR